MREFENIAFCSNNNFNDLLLMWKRFIDDVLGLFKGTEQQCEDFIRWLNTLMEGTVKFKYNTSFTHLTKTRKP